MPAAAALATVAKAVGVAVLGGVGIVGIILALNIPATPASDGAWMDAPASGTVMAPGTVSVLAHASAHDGTVKADLFVDGKHIASASGTTTPDHTLALYSFPWTATVGTHHLSIKTATGVDSRDLTVLVTSDPTSPPPGFHPPTVTATPTSSPTATTTPTAHPSPTHAPAPPKPAPTTPASPPQIGVPTAAAHISWCGGTTTVSVTASGATSVTVAVSPGGPTRTANGASGTWTVTVSSDDLPQSDLDNRDTYTLTATATGPGGTTTSGAGTLTVENCKP